MTLADELVVEVEVVVVVLSTFLPPPVFEVVDGKLYPIVLETGTTGAAEVAAGAPSGTVGSVWTLASCTEAFPETDMH